MSQFKEQNVNNGETKSKQRSVTKLSSAAIRISHKSRMKLEQLLLQSNKDRFGRKVKADDLISFSLELLTDEHLAEIRNKLLSYKDRLELLFRRVSKERKGLTRDDFFGMLLDGKVTM